MKKSSLFLLLLWPFLVVGQEIVTIYPNEERTGRSFTAISASSYSEFTFVFPGTGNRSSYTGFATITIEIDSASGTVGNRNAFSASVRPTFWFPPRLGTSDAIAGSRRRSGEAGQDSTALVSAYDWGATDSDSYVDIVIQNNFIACDGAILRIYTGANGQCKVRPQIKITKPVGL